MRPIHRERGAVVCVRQSRFARVERSRERARRQHELAARVRGLGWRDEQVVMVDEDQGRSGEASQGPSGVVRATSEGVSSGVRPMLAIETSRLARDNADWQRLIRLAGRFSARRDEPCSTPVPATACGSCATRAPRSFLSGRAPSGGPATLGGTGRPGSPETPPSGLVLPAGHEWSDGKGVQPSPDRRVTEVLRLVVGEARRGRGRGMWVRAAPERTSDWCRRHVEETALGRCRELAHVRSRGQTHPVAVAPAESLLGGSRGSRGDWRRAGPGCQGRGLHARGALRQGLPCCGRCGLRMAVGIGDRGELARVEVGDGLPQGVRTEPVEQLVRVGVVIEHALVTQDRGASTRTAHRALTVVEWSPPSSSRLRRQWKTGQGQGSRFPQLRSPSTDQIAMPFPGATVRPTRVTTDRPCTGVSSLLRSKEAQTRRGEHGVEGAADSPRAERCGLRSSVYVCPGGEES